MSEFVKPAIRNAALGGCIIVAVALFASCTWVKSTESGAGVSVLSAEQVEHCTSTGTTHVSVLDSVGVIKRSGERVAEELTTLAANSAAQLGGNAIVPVTEIDDGSQSFAVYLCD